MCDIYIYVCIYCTVYIVLYYSILSYLILYYIYIILSYIIIYGMYESYSYMSTPRPLTWWTKRTTSPRSYDRKTG